MKLTRLGGVFGGSHRGRSRAGGATVWGGGVAGAGLEVGGGDVILPVTHLQLDGCCRGCGARRSHIREYIGSVTGGKVVHTVKRAGTYAAKVPPQELHKIAVHECRGHRIEVRV